jgi:glutathione synthase/RimK-type ligase-like ATP-grasp enzyme
MDNITINEETPAPAQEIRLTDVEITNENMALNVLVSFLGVAQKRGTFSIAESAKIYECIQKFISTPAPSSQTI